MSIYVIVIVLREFSMHVVALNSIFLKKTTTSRAKANATVSFVFRWSTIEAESDLGWSPM